MTAVARQPGRGGARHTDYRSEEKAAIRTAATGSRPHPGRAAPSSRARCGARHRGHSAIRRPAASWPAPAGSAQGERLAGERRHDLRRDPDRRRAVAHRVAIASVGPAEPAQVPERRLAGLLAGADQRLDRPGRRLRIRLAALREREPPSRSGRCAARRAPGARERRRRPLPAGPRSRRRCRSSRGGRPSTTGSRHPSPARPGSPAQGSAARLTGSAQRDHRPDRLVDEHVRPVAPKPRQDAVINGVAEGRERDDPQREVRVARHIGHPRAQELGGPRPLRRVSSRRDEAERGPGGQRSVGHAALLGEAAVRALTAGEERGGSRGRAGRGQRPCPRARSRGADREPSHAHTTSVWTLRPWRSRTRRNSGPATRARTRFPSACAMLKATPAASTVTSAAQVCG